MKTYEVTIKKTIYTTITVMADTEDEASDVAMDSFDSMEEHYSTLDVKKIEEVED